eukprot:GDKJ01039684.1.p1 GENE.GDKJ01039684.1~~GDKJ01039684.1.p1  ORF type:complete len:549 (-),score=150.10 GDKJ01039684.1:59-1510(-)
MKTVFKFTTPSPIQSNAWPLMLDGAKLLASAPTGSGKTMAFLVPLLIKLKAPSKEFCRALIIQPSRELAQQTLREFQVLIGSKKFKARVLDGQLSVTDAATSSARRLDLCISTPLKMIQLLKEGQINFKELQHLVLDEADKLLDMGFQPQIDEILSFIPDISNVACHLFSATLPEGVVQLANSMIANPVRVAVGAINAAASTVDQELVFTTHEDGKLSALRQLIKSGELAPPCLIFVQSKERAKQLFSEMVYEGWLVDVMHAERTQKQRDQLIQSFREGKIWFLICTDLMARGVDFKGVKTVLNYDMPQSSATYIHRVGRTGRAGKRGKAYTFFTTSDMEIIRPVVNVMVASGCEVPEYLLKTKKFTKQDRKELQKNAPERKPIGEKPADGVTKKFFVRDESGVAMLAGVGGVIEGPAKRSREENDGDIEASGKGKKVKKIAHEQDDKKGKKKAAPVVHHSEEEEEDDEESYSMDSDFDENAD